MIKDLILIISGATICCAFYFFKDYKRNKEIKKQERLNRIKWIKKMNNNKMKL